MGKHRCVFRSRVRILSRLSERERRQNMSPLPSFVLCIPLRLRAAGCLLRSIHAAKEETVATLFLFFARIPIAGRLLPAASFPLNSAAPAAPPVPAAGAAPTRFCPRMAEPYAPPSRRSVFKVFRQAFFQKRPLPCATAPLSCGRRAPWAPRSRRRNFFSKFFARPFCKKAAALRRRAPYHPYPCPLRFSHGGKIYCSAVDKPACAGL